MRKTKFSDEDLIKCLKSYIQENNEIPTIKQFQKYNKQVGISICNRIGWNIAIMRAGFEPKNIQVKPYKEFYKADINTVLEMTKEVIDKFLLKHDRLPKAREFEKLDMPYFRFYYEKFNCTYTEFLIDILGYNEEFLSSSSR
ncbi:hypothetical protein [Maledivibacter halophilus]|uniref:Uncharacterized protein n=1 Tax=Maledivibacter halophilus TaxID=36842 RepID=A0A1T5MQD4_9FIRM|nr:hypothetical protein [Maledivibacter halophilus]SKC90402.1 hypothetical protein SAMN02194393_05154 [Maledivibacter halophilus]